MPSAEFKEKKGGLPPIDVTKRVHEEILKNPDRYPELAGTRVEPVKELFQELDDFKKEGNEEIDREKEVVRNFVGPEVMDAAEMEKYIGSLPPESQERLYALSEIIRTIRKLEEEGITPKKLHELEEIYESLPPGFLEMLKQGKEIPMNEVMMRIIEQHKHKSALSRIAEFFKHLFGL
jgi:hypothetical protein